MKRIFSFFVLAIVLCISHAALASGSTLDDFVKLNGEYYSLDLIGNSISGEWKELVCDSVPFQLPEEGVVLLLRCSKLGSPLEPKDLSDVVDEFRLYDIKNEEYLLPVGLITVEEDHDISVPGSTFDVLYYDDEYAGDYALDCQDVIYGFDIIGKYSPYRKPLRERTVDISDLPPMPEPGTITGDTRPEYAVFLEDLLEKAENSKLTTASTECPADGKMVLAVFNSYGTLDSCSLDTTFSDFPEEMFAGQLEEADYAILVHSRRERAGQYGINGGTAWKVYTLITVVDLDTLEKYDTITVSVSVPPESIKTDGLYSGGAEGDYEPEKAIEYIRDMVS